MEIIGNILRSGAAQVVRLRLKNAPSLLEDVIHEARSESVIFIRCAPLPYSKPLHLILKVKWPLLKTKQNKWQSYSKPFYLSYIKACLHLGSTKHRQHWKKVLSWPKLTLLVKIDLKGVKPIGSWIINTPKKENQARGETGV